MDRQNILSKFIHDHNLVQQYEGIKSLIKENSPFSIDDFPDGIDNSLLNLAKAYRYGFGTKKNIHRSIYLLKEALKFQNGDAALELANIIQNENWVGKSSIYADANGYRKLAAEFWELKANNGCDKASWSLYNYFRNSHNEEARKWYTRAVTIAEESDNHRRAVWLKNTFKEDQISDLIKFDLMGVPIKHLELYFQTNPPGGEFNNDSNKNSMKAIQENLLNKINSISRDLNLEEKQEIERLKELCTREV